MNVNQRKFGQIVGKSGEYIRLLIEQGMPAEGSGQRGAAVRIDTAAAIAWLLERERKKAEAEHSPATTESETRRLRAAQADLTALEVSEKRGELISAELARTVLSEGIAVMVQALEGLPGRLATTFAAETSAAAIDDRLRRELRQARALMAAKFEKLAYEHAKAEGLA